MVDGSWTYSLIPKIPVGTCSSFKPWLGLWEICTGSREFDRKISGRPADLPLNQFCNLDGSGMIWIYLSPKGCFFVFFSVLLGVFDLLLMKQTLREGIHGPQLKIRDDIWLK
jgi:hypothetical protein